MIWLVGVVTSFGTSSTGCNFLRKNLHLSSIKDWFLHVDVNQLSRCQGQAPGPPRALGARGPPHLCVRASQYHAGIRAHLSGKIENLQLQTSLRWIAAPWRAFPRILQQFQGVEETATSFKVLRLPGRNVLHAARWEKTTNVQNDVSPLRQKRLCQCMGTLLSSSEDTN